MDIQIELIEELLIYDCIILDCGCAVEFDNKCPLIDKQQIKKKLNELDNGNSMIICGLALKKWHYNRYKVAGHEILCNTSEVLTLIIDKEGNYKK